MEISRDKIKEIINDDWLLMDDCEGNKNCDVVKELARIALASLEADPVLYAAEETLAYAKHGELHLTCLSEPMGDAVIPLYTAPLAPVVDAEPVAWTSEEALSEVCCDETGMIGPQYMVGNIPLYLHAQHAPVVPDEVNLAIENLKQKLVECNRYNYCSDAVKRVEASFRAAMLKQGNNHG